MSGSTQAAARLGLRTGKQCREDWTVASDFECQAAPRYRVGAPRIPACARAFALYRWCTVGCVRGGADRSILPITTLRLVAGSRPLPGEPRPLDVPPGRG